MSALFKLYTDYSPNGDQPEAINKLISGLNKGFKEQSLLGITGSGKTFTMANIIAQQSRPTLIISHNKTLAAQLYNEFKSFFPENAVHYFVSYFDYYQPEAYIARSDTYIEKDSAINEQIDQYRLAATQSLLTRRDVIIVASVSCIYGLGKVDDYLSLSVKIEKGSERKRDKLIRHLTDIQYQRNDLSLSRGCFRVRGSNLEVFPSSEEIAYRIEFFGDLVEQVVSIDPTTGRTIRQVEVVDIFPAKHFVTPKEQTLQAIHKIRKEAITREAFFNKANLFIEAQRIRERVNYDLEILEQTGYVKGIENYSRYLTGREEGEQPATLLDYFPDDMLMFIDESHMTIPQIRGMYNGDRSRKLSLVEHGFRLPSSLDNRPLNFTEFNSHIDQVVYVSATPGEYEIEKSKQVVEQIIRPTGLLDPLIVVKPTEGQVDDLLGEINQTIAKSQRVLVTTLTKRLAEDISSYLQDLGIKVQYLHSDIDALERVEILQDLRSGKYDVLIGINLLREGIDLPEVSLVAILDADKEGFLRSTTSLIQTIGRAARHQEGRVIMYADQITKSMDVAISETVRRREMQEKYNLQNNIIPTTIVKKINDSARLKLNETQADLDKSKLDFAKMSKREKSEIVKSLRREMQEASEAWNFEKAAIIRDQIQEIEFS